MKRSNVIIVSYSKDKGGAAKASSNFYKIIKDNENFNTMFLSKNEFITSNETYKVNKFIKILDFTSMLFSRVLLVFQLIKFRTKYSLNLFSSLFVLRTLNKNIRGEDIINFHWINNDTVSIRKLAEKCRRFNVIITLHDEWLYSGASHYCGFDEGSWHNEKSKINPLKALDAINFYRKKKYTESFNKAVISVPSKWMLQRVHSSVVLGGCETYLIPNPIDTDIFKKTDLPVFFLKKTNHKIDRDKFFYICFGAVNGGKSYLKGFSLLIEALRNLPKVNINSKIPFLLIFGSEDTPEEVKNLGFDFINLGVLKSAEELAMTYSVSHVTIVPSLLESFGQVAAESLSCETPVICFDTSGLKDIVIHNNNGYLAKPFVSEGLSDGICFFLDMDEQTRLAFGRRGREHVVENFDYRVISGLYVNLIDKVRCKNV